MKRSGKRKRAWPDCYGCIYRGEVPGDAHSCCHYPGNQTGRMTELFSAGNLRNAAKLKIEADPHGFGRGWFMWPVNFDPVWLRNCEGFKPKTERRFARAAPLEGGTPKQLTSKAKKAQYEFGTLI